MQWEPEKSSCSYLMFRQNGLQAKTDQRWQRRSPHIDEGTIQQDEVTIISIYAPNNGTPNYITGYKKLDKHKHSYTGGTQYLTITSGNIN